MAVLLWVPLECMVSLSRHCALDCQAQGDKLALAIQLTSVRVRRDSWQITVHVDETGLTLDHKPPKVLGKTGQDPVAVIASRLATTTVIAAGSGVGEILPPYVIYKGKCLTAELTSGGIEETKYNTSEIGWSNSITFLDWFENHFLLHVPTKPCILLYDGHSTHITVNIINKATDNGVHLFVLPAHTSHILQPLDVSPFRPFRLSVTNLFMKTQIVL